MTDSLEVTTMETVAARLWVMFGGHGHWLDATDEERSHYRRIAVDIIDTAEPVWRSRVKEERAKTVDVLRSLSRMALLRGIPLLGRAEAPYDREKIVQDWIAECADRFEELGRV